MARRCGCATSRFSPKIQMCPRKILRCAVWLCWCVGLPFAVEAGLYSPSDQVVLLGPENVESVLVNSSKAMIVEFYASWCGHCVAFSPVYKSLVRDIKEWKPAVDLAAIDCADPDNRLICIGYKIKGYPSIKFFRAFSNASAPGQAIKGFHWDVLWLRQKIVDKLESHKEPWPPACPPLEPASQAEIDSFFETNKVQHLALIFEEPGSYVGREVTLDLLQFENIAVRRVLTTEEGLVSKFGVTEFPSCYLYYPGGKFTKLQVIIEARSFYSYALQRLPGVVRSGMPPPVIIDSHSNVTQEPWRPFNRSRVYMADMESALYFSLHMELSAHPIIKGKALTSLKNYISVLVKYFPGRPIVMNILKSVESWLNQAGDQISYDTIKDILDNTSQSPDMALPEGVRWVGCQSSQPHLRRYPCGVWTLFHVLTVQANSVGSKDPLEVLSAMRNYVQYFFGCRPCAEHFENMARESMSEVNSTASAVIWLWSRHNRVNNRVAGALSEDPEFPKIQWPSPEMCPSCHTLRSNRDHKWNKEQVLHFLMSYYSASSILSDYLESESQVLQKQQQKHASRLQALEAQKQLERKTREAIDSATSPPPSQPSVHEEEEEEEGAQEEAVAEEVVEDGEAAEMEAKPTPRVKPRSRWQARGKPSIVGMKLREAPEEIVDLDSFVNHHFKIRALELAAASRVKQRSLQRKEEQEPGPVFGLGMDLDTGLGMVGLQPIDANFDLEHRKQLQKRELSNQYFAEDAEWIQRERWMSVLSIGFSKLDISLCVFLYFLSCMCLLAMYLFFKNRLRLRRFKVALT